MEKGRGGNCKNDTAEKVKSTKKLRLKTWEDKRKSGKAERTENA